jgi:gliding motility-associated lipoprotein GldH
MRFFLLFGIVATFAACGPEYLVESRHDLPNATWAYRDSVSFDFEISDTTRLYNLFFDLHATDTFPTQNVYLLLSTRFPNGKYQRMQRSFDVFDKAGQPVGQHRNSQCQQRAMLQENAFFSQAGRYRITVAQYSRQDPLRGIASVGVAVQPLATKR